MFIRSKRNQMARLIVLFFLIDRQIGLFLKNKLYNGYFASMRNIMKECHLPSKITNVPLNVCKLNYSHIQWYFILIVSFKISTFSSRILFLVNRTTTISISVHLLLSYRELNYYFFLLFLRLVYAFIKNISVVKKQF